jgi:ribosomal protein L37AE/L43A
MTEARIIALKALIHASKSMISLLESDQRRCRHTRTRLVEIEGREKWKCSFCGATGSEIVPEH